MCLSFYTIFYVVASYVAVVVSAGGGDGGGVVGEKDNGPLVGFVRLLCFLLNTGERFY